MARSRLRNRLTVMQVSKLKRPCMLHDGGGLYLQSTQSNDGGLNKSWLLRLRLKSGRLREMGLGSALDVGLADARIAAEEARRQAREGNDPVEARKQDRANARAEQRAKRTFEECVAAYVAANKGIWKTEKHEQHWVARLEKYAYPAFSGIAVSEIDVQRIIDLLQPMWSTKTETAKKLRSRIENVLDWATVHGYRTGDNPARWRGHLAKVFPSPHRIAPVEHHPAVPFDKARDFMADLSERGGVGAQAFYFTILTASRTGETLGALWSEIDFNTAVWTRPAERMKSSRVHRVPLSTQAISLLKNLDRRASDELVFPNKTGDAPLSNMVFLMTMRRMGMSDYVPHGFRSTFRDWAAECTAHANEVAEAALAHAVGDKTEAAYRRGDLFEKRRKLMQDWADYCSPMEIACELAGASR